MQIDVFVSASNGVARPKQLRKAGGGAVFEADLKAHLDWWKLPGRLIYLGLSPEQVSHAVGALLILHIFIIVLESCPVHFLLTPVL